MTHRSVRISHLVCGIAVLLQLAGTSVAADASALPQTIELVPARFTLTGPRSQQQLVCTGTFAAEELRDLTGAVTFESSDTAVVTIDGSVVRPVGNGTAVVTARAAGQTATAEVEVTDIEATDPVRFKAEILAALTKAGCNMGACHGSPSGKGGFRLSLRGYDEALDLLTLRTEFYGRRTNIMRPDESLLLKKPLMKVAHGGGRRLLEGDPLHFVLRQWIAEGMQVDDPAEADLLRVEVYP
ncbi:MAG: Ig domain-containing protein, partial [Maioricimonas sp. JB049]